MQHNSDNLNVDLHALLYDGRVFGDDAFLSCVAAVLLEFLALEMGPTNTVSTMKIRCRAHPCSLHKRPATHLSYRTVLS